MWSETPSLFVFVFASLTFIIKFLQTKRDNVDCIIRKQGTCCVRFTIRYSSVLQTNRSLTEEQM